MTSHPLSDAVTLLAAGVFAGAYLAAHLAELACARCHASDCELCSRVVIR